VQLRDRATHTGTQAISTITGLASELLNKLDKNLDQLLVYASTADLGNTFTYSSDIRDGLGSYPLIHVVRFPTTNLSTTNLQVLIDTETIRYVDCYNRAINPRVIEADKMYLATYTNLSGFSATYRIEEIKSKVFAETTGNQIINEISADATYTHNEAVDRAFTLNTGMFKAVGQVAYFRQKGSGKILFSAGSGVTIDNTIITAEWTAVMCIAITSTTMTISFV
jgi:hypothetical protein